MLREMKLGHRMIVFIDESGIHKKVDHSTFALAYITVNNYDQIEQRILQIEKKLKINNFHWSETIWKTKKEFMDLALSLDFNVKIAIVKNPVRPDWELEKVLSHTIIEKDIKKIFIDGKKPKWYERKIKHILRDKNISVKKLKTVTDQQSAGIRLADMIAGLTRSYFDKKNPKRFNKYYKRLEKKIIILIK